MGFQEFFRMLRVMITCNVEALFVLGTSTQGHKMGMFARWTFYEQCPNFICRGPIFLVQWLRISWKLLFPLAFNISLPYLIEKPLSLVRLKHVVLQLGNSQVAKAPNSLMNCGIWQPNLVYLLVDQSDLDKTLKKRARSLKSSNKFPSHFLIY